MAPVVVVHGIFNYAKGATPAEAADRAAARWRDRLARGLSQVSADVPVPELAVAYYADLLLRYLPEQAQSADQPADFEDLDEREARDMADWLAAAGVVIPVTSSAMPPTTPRPPATSSSNSCCSAPATWKAPIWSGCCPSPTASAATGTWRR
jgi:hypothetical protein